MLFPVFPLNGAILFPETTLPLNIFEKRYISMVDYALGNQRFIGMIQTKDNGDLFNVGCLGKINSFNETTDGRYLISLEGTHRFYINEEIKKDHQFRMVDAKLIENNCKENANVDLSIQKQILQKYKIYVEKNKIKLEIKELNNLPVSQLIKFITMISPFSYLEKQTCLESKNIMEIAEKVLSILEIYSSDLDENTLLN